MVKIRLTRTGRKLDPSYRIVVADSRSPRDGRYIEQVGFFDPNMKVDGIKLDEEANNKRGDISEISTSDSKVRVFVIPTDEEYMIAKDTMNLAFGA